MQVLLKNLLFVIALTSRMSPSQSRRETRLQGNDLFRIPGLMGRCSGKRINVSNKEGGQHSKKMGGKKKKIETKKN